MIEHNIKFKDEFELESGEVLKEIQLTYHTMGTLTENSKVVWICHALTANSNPTEWWPDMVGNGKFYNPDEHFIICANVLGSCYGSTGPLSINPETGKEYFSNFPKVTIRDMVKAFSLLREHLGIKKIHSVIGSSVGGFQALEMALCFIVPIENLILLATNARVTPWSTAFSEAQRMAIYADSTYFDNTPAGGLNGLKAARAMALLSYRSYEGYNMTQFEYDEDTLFARKAATYEIYQGEKLAKRFNAYSYVRLTEALDSHNVGRFRGGVEKALESINIKSLLIGIDTDLLFPPEEQMFIHQNLKKSQFKSIHSVFGHDGFLLESEKISSLLSQFYNT